VADSGSSGGNCTFQNRAGRLRCRAGTVTHRRFPARQRVPVWSSFESCNRARAESIPHRNFIDEEIFNKIAQAGVSPAGLSTDEEFLRRVYLDLTGRLPEPRAIREFLGSADPDKRDRVIRELAETDAFTDKWTMWMGDWLRNSAANSTSGSPQQLAGRNAFYKYIRGTVAAGYSLREMTFEILSAWGNNYDDATGGANFLSSTIAPGGPQQDTYDAMLVKSATTFLGLGHYDCLMCHNGRGRLDELSLWGKSVTRQEAQKMSAFFARTTLTRWAAPRGTPVEIAQQDPYFNSYTITDVPANRTYDLNTNFGNRPNRISAGAVVRLTPEYRDTAQRPGGENWRMWFAALILDDPMFARNIVNRVWKQMFNMALADPVDGLDPARLDPANPPPDPWTFQATHPELLEKLARDFVDQGYSLPKLVKLIASSSAYQLSSRYDGDWKLEYVPLFARRYPRRLDGEEVHDAICTATGVFPQYTQSGSTVPVTHAMQLFDSVEPRSNRGAMLFMDAFLRGNRDTTSRSQNTSVQQGLALMNDTFVAGKIRMNASPALQSISRLPSDDVIVEEMFLKFISRHPSDHERRRAREYLSKAGSPQQKNAAIEDLAWSLVNKIEFVFSY
jgi:hypothetical protein